MPIGSCFQVSIPLRHHSRDSSHYKAASTRLKNSSTKETLRIARLFVAKHDPAIDNRLVAFAVGTAAAAGKSAAAIAGVDAEIVGLGTAAAFAAENCHLDFGSSH